MGLPFVLEGDSNMTTYYRLLDPEHEGMIVKANSATDQYHFGPGQGWIRSGIMLHYFSPDSDTYEQYEEISEVKALIAIDEQSP